MGGYNTFCEILSFDKRGADRAAHRAAPRAVHPRRARRRARPRRACCPTTAARDPRVMAAALRAAAARRAAPVRRRRCRACSTACERDRRPGPSPGSSGAPTARRACVRRRLTRSIGCGRAASPSFSRAIRGSPRPSSRRRSWRSSGAASTIQIVSLRQPTDRARPSGAPGDPRARCSTCPNICSTQPLRVLRGLAGAAPAMPG